MIKKLILSVVAVAAIGAAVPASAQVVVGENRHGNVVVRPARVVVQDRYHHHHRVVYYDRHHHRHYR
jgi:hypothetical protein